MGRIIKFVGLKVVELCGVAVMGAGMYGLGLWNPFGCKLTYYAFWEYLCIGLVTLFLFATLITLSVGICYGIWCVIKKNWEWAGRGKW
jgi:hypothetical protein